MKKYYVLFCLFCFQTIIPAQEKYNYSESVNKFAFDMYEQLIKNNDGNVAFSPLGLYTALAQLYIGSYGEARDEIGKALYIEEGNEEFLNDFGCFLDSIGINRNEESLTLSIANALLVNSNIKLDDWYRGSVKKYLHSEILRFHAHGDAIEKINNWVRNRTNENIKGIPITHEKFGNILLVNSFIFQDSLEEGFRKEKTFTDDFYLPDGSKISQDFMYGRGLFHGIIREKIFVVKLPYKTGSHDLFLISTQKKKEFNELEVTIRDLQITKFTRWAGLKSIDLYLPKFQIDFNYNFAKLLEFIEPKNFLSKDAGLNHSFADLDKKGKINIISSKIIFKLNEDGDKPSVEKYIEYDMICDDPIFTQLRFNHPFIYFLVEKKTGTLLLLGRYVNPGN